ncbi:hypothetical protein [uncultured Sphingomonas sp.]|uniref:hypothetical protein n=1 Tax=uncultured Sphingomonas sp. TaxID=158754 RepID=UPI0025D06ABA|nr:hypothetical protein [uncultured Sphingomonas sp.]
MVLGRTIWAAAMAAGVMALGGCTDGYGYSGVSVGAGYGGGYAPGYYGYGGGYGYAPSYFGWYDNFYYPGTGVYVYDAYRRPYRWSDTQRAYWEGRHNAWRGGPIRDQWHGWGRGGWRGPVPGAGVAPGTPGGWRGSPGGWRGNGGMRPAPSGPRPGGWHGGGPGGGRPGGGRGRH